MAIGLGPGLTVEDPEPAYEDGYIQVIVIYRFQPVTPLIANFFGEYGYIDLTSKARQLIETPYICPST